MRFQPRILIGFICLFFIFPFITYAEDTIFTKEEWLRKLSDNSVYSGQFLQQFELVPVSKRAAFLAELEAAGTSDYFNARLLILKAHAAYMASLEDGLKAEPMMKSGSPTEIVNLLERAIQLAYKSENDYLIAEISINYAEIAYALKQYEASMMYFINGLELKEKLGIPINPFYYRMLGELLYKIKEYQESIHYSVKSIQVARPMQSTMDSISVMWAHNTTALSYHRLQQFDSAFFYYNRGLDYANMLNMELWRGIISGNMGQVYFELQQFDKALPLLLFDYSISKEADFLDNSANSLQWAARTQLALGNKTKALEFIREAFGLLKNRREPFYERNANNTAFEVFKALGAYDSALYYNKKYEFLKDSLDRVIALSSIKVSKIKANDEKNRYQVMTLQREKEKKELERNILIIVLLLLCLIGLLLFNRHQLKSRLKLEQLEGEKRSMEVEIESARNQLSIITEKVAEKTNLIEKLEKQIQHKTNTEDQQALVIELAQQTILTEEEWFQFKSLFQTIYPTFFAQLKQQVPDITLAEQRLAALIRLQLTSKQIASMLGISVDSVHKTRQRLRQRFNITKEVNIEAFIAAI
ncbi:hypothetical protein GCM10027036_12690 [Flavihumibacter cheonanensis]|uniref:tetratricopeptide repeat protein n=1 Tax=Flavihumibacter cheonanensis TaxID=1442385 RepID=UPI001EF841B1|nr:hypothetical protein [Flavihumibacter cheonanensis]MCG7751291.1 hypothetical protein [Flavihumibacter cheonanensis]